MKTSCLTLALLGLCSFSHLFAQELPVGSQRAAVTGMQVKSLNAALASADIQRKVAAKTTWMEVPTIKESAVVRVWFSGPRMDAAKECFVITHGMGGTTSGDSFHRLALAIHQALPGSCVVRLDWSERASAKIGGFPHPWKVAGSIDEVGDQAALVLKGAGLSPAHTTLFGESFGNWVNARISRQFDGVRGILALNPANEGGGYALPDLRKHARRSWSFHTYSVFDTTLEIAESDFWLETPTDATHWGQHVAGINWLAARTGANDLTWLKMDKPLPERRAGCYQATATLDGQLSDHQPSRERPVISDSTHAVDNRQLSATYR